jgi:hypothetical protein
VAIVRTTRHKNQEDTILHSHRRENLKSYIVQAWQNDGNYTNFLIANIILTESRLTANHAYNMKNGVFWDVTP